MLVSSCQMMHIFRPVVVLLCLLLYTDAESKIIHLCLGPGYDEQFWLWLVVTKVSWNEFPLEFVLKHCDVLFRSLLIFEKKIICATFFIFLFNTLFLNQLWFLLRWWKPLWQNSVVKAKTDLACKALIK